MISHRALGHLLHRDCEFRIGSKTAVTWDSVRAFQLVSSTPMNGLEMTLARFKKSCRTLR
jgi:hypothetical protein